MQKRKYYSEKRMNEILEEIAQKITETASSPEEAAQIVRAAKNSNADIMTDTPGHTPSAHLLEASAVPGISPEEMISMMELLHSTPDEYVLRLHDGTGMKVLSRHKDKEEAMAAGKKVGDALTQEKQYIDLVSGEIADDGKVTGPMRFFEKWDYKPPKKMTEESSDTDSTEITRRVRIL